MSDDWRSDLGSLRSWFAGVAAWLAEARLLWLAVGVLASLLAIARLGATEPAIRLSGLALELLGSGTVAWGIRDTWRLFGHPGPLSRTAAWLRRFPVYRRSVVVGVGAASAGAATAIGRGHVSANPPTDATLEERVAFLEANLRQLDNRVTGVLRDLEAAKAAQTSALRRESEERAGAETLIRKQVKDLGTGGLDISLIGALWLFAGVILSTAAPELALR